MLTLIFVVSLIYVFIKMLVWSFKAAWGIAKIVAFVILLPLLIIGLAISGLFFIAFGLAILFAVIVTVGTLVGV